MTQEVAVPSSSSDWSVGLSRRAREAVWLFAATTDDHVMFTNPGEVAAALQRCEWQRGMPKLHGVGKITLAEVAAFVEQYAPPLGQLQLATAL